ncbi:MAG: methionyl-tRNA formyltransferase [Magnetococcales bacterium]|nr:methionyl-tRNA formyltransferase [Magnetococcales bacterium]
MIIGNEVRWRVLFMGTPTFAVPALAALLAGPDCVVGVVTQPDRPHGRGMQLRPPPVKELALQQGLPVWQPDSLRRDEAVLAEMASLRPDVIVVAAYGQILPAAVLDLPPQGCINIHASLLPRWRGAAPIQRAILAGDRETGVTIMAMEAGLDTGPMLAQRVLPLDDQISCGTLHDQLAQSGAELLLETLAALKQPGRIVPVPQQESLAVYAHKLSRDEEWIDWQQPAPQLLRQVRALSPWPGARARLVQLPQQEIKVVAARAVALPGSAMPGHVVATDGEGPLVACGAETALLLLQLQPAGKRVMSGREWLRGRPLTLNEPVSSGT